MAYEGGYHADSDADDEFERGPLSPAQQHMLYESSPTDSDPPSNENTPTTFTHSGVNHASPRGLITQWTADQCADWVTSLGLEQYSDAIVDELIDGEALVALQHADLKDLGITSVGHRLTILKGVYDVKIRQNVPIDPDHYVPLSADANAPDAHATQDDVARIINQIKIRDERVMGLEAELRRVQDDLTKFVEEQRKLREDTLPLIKQAKDRSQPLPTPEGLAHETNTSPHASMQPEPKSSSLARKFSAKKLFLNSSLKLPSPTIHESTSLDPSAAAMAASSHLTASMSSGPAASPLLSQQPSPTSPPSAYGAPPSASRSFRGNDVHVSARAAHQHPDDPWTWSNASTAVSDRDRNHVTGGSSRSLRPSASTATSLAPAATNDLHHSNSRRERDRDRDRGRDRDRERVEQDRDDATTANEDFMKSFRISMEEPCRKVLPVALKKYRIDDDWQKYALYIVYGDQERCLGLDERPLNLFKQFASEGKKPMFMLRKHAVADGAGSLPNGPDDVGVAAGTGNAGGVGQAGTVFPGKVVRQSYASTTQLPGGVL